MGVGLPDSRLDEFLSEDASLNPFVPSLCVREPLTGVLRPRNFAVLLFGRNVQRFIPGAFSIFSVYPGTDRSDRHAERHELPGTLIDQARRLQPMLDAQIYTVFDKSDREAPNAVKYPQRALYEAMGNALAHRDYELPDPVRITAFADRVEFVSPGSVPFGLDAVAFEHGEALPKWRNQALAWFFSRLQLAQAEGQGIPTIFRTMRAEGCPPPSFKTTPISVVCVLPAHPRHVILGAIVEAERAIVLGDLQRACSSVELIVDRLDQPERLAAIDPSRLIELAWATADLSDDPGASRKLVVRLVAAIGKLRLSEPQLRRAADLLFRYGEVAGVVGLIDDQLSANTTWAWRPRLLALAGDLLLRAAVQAVASAGRSDKAPHDRQKSVQDFDSAAEEATKLFIMAEGMTDDPAIAAIARRALAIIRHLAQQRAPSEAATDAQSDC
jgi:hypothetical protein